MKNDENKNLSRQDQENLEQNRGNEILEREFGARYRFWYYVENNLYITQSIMLPRHAIYMHCPDG